MVTKIFVSQIDSTNSDGTTASNGSYIKLVGGVAVWEPVVGAGTGYSGSIGSTGFTGSSGFGGFLGSAGFAGSVGTAGFLGSTGSAGFTGSLGAAGFTGSLGFGGFIGSAGFAGSRGFTGSAGTLGFLGSAGFEGSQGAPGLVGPMGAEGYYGSTGYTGSVGSSGFTGSLGFGGFVGSVGFGGSIGNVGFQGSVSSGGFRGSSGFQGSVGSSGFIGSAGNVGFAGSAGAGGGSGGSPFPFNHLTDLSPNTYPTKANYLVKVNSSASGITLVDGNTYVTYTPAANITFNAAAANAYLKTARTAGYSELIYRSISATNTITGISSALYNLAYILLSPTSGTVVTITLPTDVLTSHGNNHYTIVLYLKQDATGSRTVDWSTNTIKWAVGDGIAATGPTLTTTPNNVDVVCCTTFDGGASWYGFVSARGFTS